VLSCLVFALLGASAFQARGNALDDARADAAQLVRVQSIATNVVEADSLFTNGYLAYGLESTQQRNEYEAAISLAARTIAQASRANPTDAADLAQVNQALTLYSARVAAARANSNQGFQVGTGYLRQAANLLRDDKTTPNMLPTLDKLIWANTQRVEDAYSASRWATLRLVLAALVVLAGLGVVQVWLARQTHRYLNVPLAAASGAVVLVLVVGAVVMASAESAANDVHDKSYASTLALARARIAVFTGKSQESISLIYLGTGGDSASAEKAYQDAYTAALAQLGVVQRQTGQDSGVGELTSWNKVHAGVYTTAQTNWTKAATLATNRSDPLNTHFTNLDGVTKKLLDTEATAVDKGLSDNHGVLLLLGWLTLVIGLVAAGAAWAGVSQRLEEYR
jgi:hypothetical protein